MPLGDAGPEILHEHVGARDQPLQHLERRAAPSGSSTIERLLRLLLRNEAEKPPRRLAPARVWSPPAGFSTLITSAPWSPGSSWRAARRPSRSDRRCDSRARVRAWLLPTFSAGPPRPLEEPARDDNCGSAAGRRRPGALRHCCEIVADGLNPCGARLPLACRPRSLAFGPEGSSRVPLVFSTTQRPGRVLRRAGGIYSLMVADSPAFL